jgi:hypothetical protein
MSDRKDRIDYAHKLADIVRSWSDRKLYVTYSQTELGNRMKLKTKSTGYNYQRTSGSCRRWFV